MLEGFNTIDHHDGNIVLIFFEQLFVRFNIDLFKREGVGATRGVDCSLGLVAEMTARS